MFKLERDWPSSPSCIYAGGYSHESSVVISSIFLRASTLLGWCCLLRGLHLQQRIFRSRTRTLIWKRLSLSLPILLPAVTFHPKRVSIRVSIVEETLRVLRAVFGHKFFCRLIVDNGNALVLFPALRRGPSRLQYVVHCRRKRSDRVARRRWRPHLHWKKNILTASGQRLKIGHYLSPTAHQSMPSTFLPRRFISLVYSTWNKTLHRRRSTRKKVHRCRRRGCCC
ncbi:hypothetical protein BDZ89DRAFT_822889 [Hymenopellis radicata]|nr:hypothetical protein BDZ89DRAFT_822889 [Hymenopellis radicata]